MKLTQGKDRGRKHIRCRARRGNKIETLIAERRTMDALAMDRGGTQ